jgi:hypothetical protein
MEIMHLFNRICRSLPDQALEKGVATNSGQQSCNDEASGSHGKPPSLHAHFVAGLLEVLLAARVRLESSL